jgi:hypothetical protein
MALMDPKTIIEALGGPGKVAELCKVTPQAVSQWYGTDPETNEPRSIPPARLMYLQVIRPKVFRQLQQEQSKAA